MYKCMYIQYIQGLSQSRLSTADHALLLIDWFHLLVNTVIILLKLQILNVLCECAALNAVHLSTSKGILFYYSSRGGLATTCKEISDTNCFKLKDELLNALIS
jgi:hypothetical protein